MHEIEELHMCYDE
jgi:hypothetical protein